MSIRLKMIFFVIILIPFLVNGQSGVNIEKLGLGKEIIKEMGGEEFHTYSLELETNKFLFGRVKQEGIDVVVKVFNPLGEKIEEIDSPTGSSGFENIILISDESGEYKIEIHPFESTAEKGSYRLKIERIEDEADTENGKVDQLFVAWDRKDSPGAAVTVVKNGQIIFKKGYGIANLEYNIPITPSTIFHMASVSKQFTACAVAMLAQQNKLSLDDDIRIHIPEVPDFGEIITIKHLIHHTSGLRDQWNLLVMAGWRMDDVITKDHIMKLVEKQKELNFSPGEEYLYCNTGYTLLAEIVERVSGETYSDWCQKKIFEPLGMRNTLFYDDHEKIVKNRAYSYSASGDIFKKSVLSYANVGATSLFTTCEDLSKWAVNFNDPIIGNRKLFKQMEERGILIKGDTISYAFGQGIGKYKGLNIIGHSGGDAGYRTYLGRFPDEKFSVMVLSNLASFNPSSMAFKIADIYLADLITYEEPEDTESEEISVEVDQSVLEEYSGRYDLGDVIAEIIFEKDQLFGQVPGQPRIELVAQSETEFISENGIKLSFQRNVSGKVDQITVNTGSQIIAGKKIESSTILTEKLDQYTGEFYSDELSTLYEIVFRDDKLFVQHRKNSDFYLTMQKRDKFIGSAWYFGQIEFERDENDVVSGFRVSNGRVRNLKFVRI
ncbi:serine hydrolase domain-containing protein [Bacteroidota bacterium]